MASINVTEKISDTATAVWYQAILNRYNTTTTANNNLDTKTGVIIGATVALLIYVTQITTAPRLLAILGGIGLVVTIGLCLKNIHARPNSTEVHTSQDRPDYYDQKDEGFYWQIIPDLEDSLTKIAKINKTKGLLYIWSVYIFVFSSALVILSQYIRFTITLGWQ
jgi:hypothetical protein